MQLSVGAWDVPAIEAASTPPIRDAGSTDYPRDYVAIFASLDFDVLYWRRPDDRVNEPSLLHVERRTTA